MYAVLKEWSTFCLLDNNTYICFMKDNEKDEKPTAEVTTDRERLEPKEDIVEVTEEEVESEVEEVSGSIDTISNILGKSNFEISRTSFKLNDKVVNQKASYSFHVLLQEDHLSHPIMTIIMTTTMIMTMTMILVMKLKAKKKQPIPKLPILKLPILKFLTVKRPKKSQKRQNLSLNLNLNQSQKRRNLTKKAFWLISPH